MSDEHWPINQQPPSSSGATSFVRHCKDCGTEQANPYVRFCARCGSELPAVLSAPTAPLLGMGTAAMPAGGSNAPAAGPAAPAWLALGGCALAALGSFLGWLSAQASSGYGVSLNGFDSHILDGWYVLIFAAIVAAVELIALMADRDAGPAQSVGELILGGWLLVLAARYLSGLSAAGNAVAASWLSQFMSVSAGPGLWCVAIGAVLIVAGGLWRLAAALNG